MTYLLDTNTCIRFINGRAPNIRTHLIAVGDQAVMMSSIVKAEMYAGSAKSQTPQRSRAIQEQFFRRFVTLPFDSATARTYGDIRAYLEQQGMPIGGDDMLIAATALTHNLILVTHNTREFQRIPGLMLDDWEI
jgi:tRNA(fMet)-specific endonuclease VapC